jgi:hypothetical protein
MNTEKVLKLWETENTDYQDRVAVPGGWALVVYSWNECGRRVVPGVAIRVDDPTAPHVRKVAAAEERIVDALAALDSMIRGDSADVEAIERVAAILRGE